MVRHQTGCGRLRSMASFGGLMADPPRLRCRTGDRRSYFGGGMRSVGGQDGTEPAFQPSNGCVTQSNEPPTNPGRFTRERERRPNWRLALVLASPAARQRTGDARRTCRVYGRIAEFPDRSSPPDPARAMLSRSRGRCAASHGNTRTTAPARRQGERCREAPDPSTGFSGRWESGRPSRRAAGKMCGDISQLGDARSAAVPYHSAIAPPPCGGAGVAGGSERQSHLGRGRGGWRPHANRCLMVLVLAASVLSATGKAQDVDIVVRPVAERMQARGYRLRVYFSE